MKAVSMQLEIRQQVQRQQNWYRWIALLRLRRLRWIWNVFFRSAEIVQEVSPEKPPLSQYQWEKPEWRQSIRF